MGATDKKAIFAYISSMARQVCAVSEQAEKTGVLGGLDYVLLQSLGYAIVQHVALIDRPRGVHTAASASEPSLVVMVEEEEEEDHKSTSTPLPRSAGDTKAASSGNKRKLGQHTGESPSLTSSEPKRKRSGKEETATTAPGLGRRPNASSLTAAAAPAATTNDEPAKKCLDCGRTKTNQWRSGPKGMSTLCNACGMRYTRRLKRQGLPMPATSNNNIRRGSGVLDSPMCGHESDHGLSPISSPLPFEAHSSPMLDDSAMAGQQEKRSNLYTLLN